MNVLLAGNTRYLTNTWVRQAFPSGQVVVAGQSGVRTDRKNGILCHPGEELEQRLHTLFEAYVFGQVVWFSSRLTPGEGTFTELDQLRQLLSLCGSETQVLCLEGPAEQSGDGPDLLAACIAELCSACRAQVQQVRLPWLYGAGAAGDLLCRAFAAMAQQQDFVWPVEEDCPVCFLAMEDLAELVRRMTEEWTLFDAPLTVPDCFGLTMETVAQRAAALWPQAPAPRFARRRIAPQTGQSAPLRAVFKWFPRYCILEDLPAQKQLWQSGQQTAPEDRRLVARLRRHPVVSRLAELLLGCLLAEGLTAVSGGQMQFRMMDFRLLYIVLMGTVHGMQWGIGAAALESVCLVRAYAAQNISWLTLFYEPTNWVVFLAYFLVGAACGYVRGKSRNDLEFARQENEGIRKKFSFLRQLYQDTVRSNDEMRRQIVSSQDSFGKIFRVTQELDVMEPKQVFLHAVQILEEFLDNESISIYSVGSNKRFARLEASSRPITHQISQSLRLDALSAAMPTLQKGEVWANTGFLPGYPMYVAAVRENGEPVLLIQVHQAAYEQMTLYFQNLFKVLCGLVQTALLRALQVQKMQHAERCLPGTIRMLRPDAFRHEVEVTRSMQEAHVSCYQLLRVDPQGRTPEEVETLLMGRIRENDELGMLEDGSVWLLLSQVTPENLPYVLQRLGSCGLEVQVREDLEP